MFERIVVAVDGSAKSDKTINVALDMARRYGSAVTVVHVREYERYDGDEVDLGGPYDGVWASACLLHAQQPVDVN